MERYLQGMIRNHGPDPIMMFMQVPIDEYRVDFLIYGISADCDDRSTWGRVKLVVECDGHDFHEKTKQQAKRDKQRDRKLMSKGYSVMRFTGSEIWNDPRKAVHEVLSFVRKAQSHHRDIRSLMS
jgi:very-short-patch-repair endonuclease